MRETKVLKLADGTEVELKTYLTGGESRAIQNSILDGVEFNEDMKPKFSAVSISKSQDETIKQMVVRIGEAKEDLATVAQDLRAEVFEELLKKLDEVRNGWDKKKS